MQHIHFQLAARAVTDLDPLPGRSGLLRLLLIHPDRRCVGFGLSWVAAMPAVLPLDGQFRVIKKNPLITMLKFPTFYSALVYKQPRIGGEY